MPQSQPVGPITRVLAPYSTYECCSIAQVDPDHAGFRVEEPRMHTTTACASCKVASRPFNLGPRGSQPAIPLALSISCSYD